MPDNLKYNNIISDIKNNSIKNLYLFYGTEILLIDDVISKIEKQVISPGLKSLNYIKLDGQETNYESIINACETLPFMDERKMVVVRNCPYFKGRKSDKDTSQEDTSGDELLSYLPHIPGTTILILFTGSEIDKRRKVYSIIKKHGDVVEFNQLKGQELIKWILKGFEQNRKKVSNSDVLYFSDRVTGSLTDILNEINKLCSYAGDNDTVTRQDIDKVVPRSLEYNIFQLVDSVSSKNPGPALSVLNELLLDSEPIPVILAMVIRQFRLLLNTKLLIQKGYSVQDLGGKLGVPPFISSSLYKLSGKYTEEQLENRLKCCLEADGAIKSGKMEQRLAIESLIVEFAK